MADETKTPGPGETPAPESHEPETPGPPAAEQSVIPTQGDVSFVLFYVIKTVKICSVEIVAQPQATELYPHQIVIKV